MLGNEIYDFYFSNDNDDFTNKETDDNLELFTNDDEDENSFEINFYEVLPIIFKSEEEQDIDYYSLNLEEDDSKYVDED